MHGQDREDQHGQLKCPIGFQPMGGGSQAQAFYVLIDKAGSPDQRGNLPAAVVWSAFDSGLRMFFADLFSPAETFDL